MANPEHVGRWSEHVAGLECAHYVPVIKEHATGDLLDVGAGTVPYFGIYRDLIRSAICTDWTESPHELKHIDAIVDANQPLPFRDESFDTILVADVFEHLSHPIRFMRETRRILRPDGKVIFFMPFMYWLHEQPNDHFRYTKHAMHSLALDAGLDVVDINEYGGGPDIIIDASQKMLANNRALYTAAQLVWSAYRQTRHYQKARAKHQERLPIGYSFVAQRHTTVD